MQAQEFINTELAKREAEMRAMYQEELERKVALALAGQPSQATTSVPTVEMQESTFDVVGDLPKQGSRIGQGTRMGTRKNPGEFGK